MRIEALQISGDTIRWVNDRYKPTSFISWIGGKSQLRKEIAKHIPADIEAYVEVFGGGGWVMFYKENWAGVEVYNDINSDLVNLFRIAKYHPNALVEEMENTLYSREEFDNHKDGFLAVTDIQRAYRMLYLLNYSYSKKMDAFGYQLKESRAGNQMLSLKERLSMIHNRLKKVIIENLDYATLIGKYDASETFFYCDPPYVGYCNSLKIVYNEIHHEKLRDTLADIKGRFLLSYNDHPVVRELYKDFPMIELTRKMTLGNQTDRPASTDYKELLIRNY